jgi:hypothetical protein
MAATPANSLTLVSSGLADARQQAERGNPDINQFVKVLRKTTRWAAQYNRVEFDGAAEFGTRVSMTLPRLGELVTGVTIAVTMPDLYATQLTAIKAAGGTSLTNLGNFLGPITGWTNSLGHALIQQIELEIGGTIVETLDSRMLEILDELYETVESVVSKNVMIKRASNNFNARTWLTPDPATVYVPIPFWFSRPGVYGQALPLDAMYTDQVRIHVTFRPINQLIYSEARVDPRTVGYNPLTDDLSALWPLTGGKFWRANPSATGRVFSMNVDTPGSGINGEVIPGITFPLRFTPTEAYALVEYISLEEYEALTLRTAELTYQVIQHVAVPSQATLYGKEIRLALPYSAPTKEILWVLQRPEAELYNAWFLFSRDLGPVTPPQATPQETSPCAIPWWPNATIIPLPANNWQIVPGFQTAASDPLDGAILLYNSFDRFVHEGPSYFRAVVPSQYYTKPAIINRYIYAYSFGQRKDAYTYGPTGVANWDKIPRKEIYLTLANGRKNTTPPNLNLYVYMSTWNVFKVYGGRGGMLFTN